MDLCVGSYYVGFFRRIEADSQWAAIMATFSFACKKETACLTPLGSCRFLPSPAPSAAALFEVESDRPVSSFVDPETGLDFIGLRMACPVSVVGRPASRSHDVFCWVL